MHLSNIKHLFLEEVVSTNDYLKNNYINLENNTFISTNFQTKGRGQFLRKWESKRGVNILISWLIKDSKSSIFKIRKHVTNVLINVLKSKNIDAYFEYPNDIFVNEKKIAGILIETKGNKQQIDYIIVGIGLNVNQDEYDELKAISMKNITNEIYDIDKLKNELINKLIEKL